MATLTEAEWLSEMERLVEKAAGREDEGLTVKEWAERLGRHERDVRVLLHAALSEGRLVRGWRNATGLDGRVYKAPVYALTSSKSNASAPTSRPRKAGSSRD